MKPLKQNKQYSSLKNITYFLSFLAGALTIIQSWLYLHQLETNLDEGAYLYKGYLFATGSYSPFQMYGFWTNKMPLAFLIPGYIQKWFGPGLAVGRYFMVLALGLTLLGLWIVVRRINGDGWATLALIIVAINPVLIKMYSTAVTQGLTACILTWVLVFSLGEKRSLLQLSISSLLASLLVLIRINLLPVPVFLILYILWQYGWKAGILSFIMAALPIIGVHVLYWPNILQIYIQWVPRGLIPILDSLRIQHPAQSIWHPDLNLENRLISIARTFRFHFLLMIGSIASLMVIQRKFFLNQRSKWREQIFLLFLFWVLFFAHVWATLGGDYCNYCLEGYISFFAPLGIVLFISTVPVWERQFPKYLTIGLIIFIILTNATIGLALIDDFHFGILYIPLPRFLLNLPKFEGGWFLPVEVIRNVLTTLTDRQTHILDIISTSTIIGLLMMVLIFIIWKGLDQNSIIKRQTSYGYVLLISVIIVGFGLSPSPILSGGLYTYDCAPTTLNSYETTGKALAELIPPESQVFWKSMSATPLLYVPDIQIYPPQVNDIYSFYVNGNDDELLKFGLWNESLARQWLKEADYIVIEDKYFSGFYRSILKSGRYQLITILPSQSSCRENSRLRVYQPIR